MRTFVNRKGVRHVNTSDLTAAGLLAAGALAGWLATSSGLPGRPSRTGRDTREIGGMRFKVLPVPDAPFRGVMGETVKESRSDFPKQVTAPARTQTSCSSSPTTLGSCAASTFGGPIPTPAMDRLAKSGLIYNQFHTTALCSPTRAALLTGRNHQSVGFGNITEFASGYPGYDSVLPKSAARSATFWWTTDTTPRGLASTTSSPYGCRTLGPHDQWAGGLGFEYFYGFLGGDTDQWHPALFENNRPQLSRLFTTRLHPDTRPI